MMMIYRLNLREKNTTQADMLHLSNNTIRIKARKGAYVAMIL